MINFHDINTWLGIAALVCVIGLLAYVIIDSHNKGKTIDQTVQALVDTLQAVNQNQKLLDLAEGLATKVVPASMVKSANTFADFIEGLTPDEIDKLIEEVRKFGNQITDGLPNVPGDQVNDNLPEVEAGHQPLTQVNVNVASDG